MAAVAQIMVFWVFTSCSMKSWPRNSEGRLCLHLQGWSTHLHLIQSERRCRWCFLSKLWNQLIILHSTKKKTQRTSIWIFKLPL